MTVCASSVGGDRNVYFPVDGRSIHRSSNTLVEDGRGDGTQCLHANDLCTKLRESGALTVEYVGGRYADIGMGHDGRMRTVVRLGSVLPRGATP